MLGNVASTKVGTVEGLFNQPTTVVVEEPTTTFQENDLAVTKTSAKLPEAGAVEGPSLKRNHALMSNRDIALLVINNTRPLQPQRKE